jgi:Flp pilus assembly protein TadG
MRPRKREAAAAAIIRHRSMARGVIACAWRFARFKAAKAKSLGERGAAMVEFGLLAPVLLLILLGTAQFGLTLNQYVLLTNAVSIGGLQFALSRSDTTPYTDAVSAVQNAAKPTLTPASLTITLSVGSPLTACGSDATCMTALTNNVGQPAQVTATYPCNLHVMWYNFAPVCNLTSQVTERVQ